MPDGEGNRVRRVSPRRIRRVVRQFECIVWGLIAIEGVGVV